MLTLSNPQFSRISSLPQDAHSGIDQEALQQDALLARGLRLLTAATRSDALHGALPERLGLLRQHQALAADLVPALRARMESGAADDMARARWVARLAQQIELAIHNGFKRAAVDGSAAKGLFVRQRPTVEALALAMASGWRLAALHAQTYTVLPRGFWADVHSLFAYAVEQGWEDKAADPGEPAPAESYRRILLLGMTGSNRYEADQIDMLLGLVAELAPEVVLAPLGRADVTGNGAFIFQAQSDGPPLYSVQLPHPGGAYPYTVVDVERTAQQLQRRIDTLQNAVAPSPRRLQLYARVHQEWTQPSQRRHARRRRAGDDRVELVASMQACWDAVNQERGHGGDPDWARRYTEAVAAADTTAPVVDTPASTPAPPAMLTVSNISHSGLLLQGESGGQSLASGELVAYRRVGKSWRVGLIRWVSFRVESLVTQCGIEYIGGTLDAVLAAPIASQAAGGYLPALRLGGRNMLVMPGRYFQPFRAFVLADSRGSLRIQVVRLALQSAQYQVMEYQVTGPAEG